jgi:hypothetical protein
MHRRRRRPLARRLLPALLLAVLVIPGQGLAASSSSKGANAAKAEISHGPLVAPHLFTGNLKDLPAPLVAAGPPHATHDHTTRFGTQKQGPEAPAVPKAAASIPAPSSSFKGLDVTGGGANAIPPDPVGDVGPNHYVQAVNSAFAVYNKTGTQLAATTFNSFFDGTGTACDANNQGDPTVVYDPLADRWIVADFATTSFTSPPFYECIGVSKTSDPVAGGWYQYAVRTDDPAHQWVAADYPKMGIWPDGLYMTANMFDSSDVFKEVRVWAFNRADLESGSPLHQVVADVGTGEYFSLLPSNLRGAAPPVGSPNYLVSESTSAFAFEVWKFHPDYTGGGTTFTGPTEVSQANYTYAPLTVAEPSPGNGLDTVSDRLMMQNQYRNLGGAESIWVNHTVKTGATGPVGIQWAQLNVTGGTIAAAPVQQQVYGNVGSDGVGRWLGSLAVDKAGDMALGYSASSGSVAPDIRYAGRLASDPLGTLPQGEASLLGGVSRAVQAGDCSGAPCNRWGDYSAMTVDPDGCTFWYTNEYLEANGLSWQTRIGSFSYPSCTSPTSINWAAQNSVDFDGNHQSDLGALYRGLSPDSLWYAPGTFQIYFGAASDVPVPGDYNGDGKTDAVIFRPSTGLWYGPATGLPQIVIQMSLGQSGDIPIPGDYDGDGKTDPAIYRPSSGLFFAVLSGGGTKSSTFGSPGDVPVPRDYDGDGKTDFAIYRANASNGLGLWYAPLSGGGVYQIYFGAAGDIPVPGDYNGDKKAEAVIFREATGLWYGPYNGAPGLFQLNLGGNGDVPIPGYYDNNLSMDPAIYHKANGLWFTLLSGGGTSQMTVGTPTDVPVQKRPTLAGGL